MDPRWAGGSASGEGRYVRQFDAAAAYGHVRIRISPGLPGSGLVFRNESAPGIETGFLVEDMTIELVDGSYHDVDSSEAAFRMAAVMAFRDAVHNAGFMSDTSGDDRASSVREPRRPRPVPRDSAVALPEPKNEESL